MTRTYLAPVPSPDAARSLQQMLKVVAEHAWRRQPFGVATLNQAEATAYAREIALRLLRSRHPGKALMSAIAGFLETCPDATLLEVLVGRSPKVGQPKKYDPGISAAMIYGQRIQAGADEVTALVAAYDAYYGEGSYQADSLKGGFYANSRNRTPCSLAERQMARHIKPLLRKAGFPITKAKPTGRPRKKVTRSIPGSSS